MHVVFFQNPEIIFYYFLHILNLDIFWVIILQKSIGSRYLVPLTPPTVFGRSFWNFTWAFKMAWKYACGFFQNPEIIFITFSAFYLDIFWVLILQKCIGSRYLVPLILPQFLADSFETLHRLLGWPEDMHVFFENPVIIFYYFFRIFNLDIFWVLILQKRIGSSPRNSYHSFYRSIWNFTGVLRMVWRYACIFSESWNYFLSLVSCFNT